jgi:PAS domain-containing protein
MQARCRTAPSGLVDDLRQAWTARYRRQCPDAPTAREVVEIRWCCRRGFVIFHDMRKAPASKNASTTESQVLLNALMEATPLAIVALDLEGRVNSWNLGAERMFGWTAAEVIGHHCRPCLLKRQWSRKPSAS